MVLDQVLQFLSESPANRPEADRLARTGFMEWLWSLPGEADYSAHAAAADERAALTGGDAPALQAFRHLLREARTMPVTPVRRGGAQRRRCH